MQSLRILQVLLRGFDFSAKGKTDESLEPCGLKMLLPLHRTDNVRKCQKVGALYPKGMLLEERYDRRGEGLDPRYCVGQDGTPWPFAANVAAAEEQQDIFEHRQMVPVLVDLKDRQKLPAPGPTNMRITVHADGEATLTINEAHYPGRV